MSRRCPEVSLLARPTERVTTRSTDTATYQQSQGSFGLAGQSRIENPFLSQSKNNLIKNFPTTLLSSIKARLSPQRGRYAGWRVGVLFAIMGVSFVLVINVIVTIWACIRYSVIDELGTIYEGSCGHTKTLSRWIHFGINALSTVALSGSNYTQQCLMSPSREEVDRAHLKGKWLDIGVPSVRNIWSIDRRRMLLWWAILLTSIPLHLLYNSAVFSTITANNYAAAIVAENIYTESPPIHDANAKQWKDIIDESRVWLSLSPIDCVKAYNTPLQSRYGNLIVITYGENKTEGLVQSIQVHVSDNPTPQNWIGCPFSCSNETDSLKNITKTGEWTFHYAEIQPYRNTKTGEWTYGNVVQRTYTVKECRAERTPEVCKLQFSVGILSAVILCNAVKIVCMILAFANSSFVPLATIGDAIQSFLMVPDRSTLGRCYASKKFIDNDQRDDSPWNNGYFKPRARRRVRCRWWCAVSARRSAVSLLYMTGVVTGTACLLSLALDTTSGASFYDIWNLGLGQVNAGIVVTAFGKHMSLAFAVLLANSPQIILSFLYLLYNALFTNMLMGLEWNNYAQSRKTLRVTRPCGDQRGTYNLNLPYRYGVPLMIFSALLHWLASQSVFLVRIKTENRSFLQGSANQQHELISTAGLSAMALMFALLIGVLAVIAVLLSGCRVYPYDMAIAGSCSAAISAACHSIKMDEWEREQLVLKPLQWGDVGIVEVGVRHLSFSDEAVEAPRKFELYA